MRAGQGEILIIVGIVVVVIVVSYFALQMISNQKPLVTGIENQKRLLKNTIDLAVKEAAMATLEDISTHGGYLDPAFPLGVVLYGKDLPYWQYRGVITMPDVKSNFADGVTLYLSQSKDSLIEASKQEIDLQDPTVSVSIQDDRIDLTVDMQAVLWFDEKPYQIDPSIVSVSSRLGEILSFSDDFLRESQTSRYLETFTMASILTSPFDGPVRKIPFTVALTECGENVYKTWYDVKPEMEYTIKNTLAHIYMPGNYPTDVIRTTGSPKYSLPEIGSKDYSDLDVTFHVPDGFELDIGKFQMKPNVISAYTKPIQFTDICYSDPILVNYYLNYPSVVRIKDDLTGNIFQFAVDVMLKDNQPAPWSAGLDEMTDQEIICTNMFCSADLTVLDEGVPIQGAYVSFMGCPLGSTDLSGRLQADAPCGAGSLIIDKTGYHRYDRIKSTSDENQVNQLDAIIQLGSLPVLNLFFYEVDMIKQADGNYFVPFGGISDATGDVNLEFAPIDNSDVFQPITTSSGVYTISHVPVGDYHVSAILSETESFTLRGAMLDDYSITKADTNLYIYIPTMVGVDQLGDEDRLAEIYRMSAALRQCEIGPVMTDEYEQTQACVASI